MGKTQQLFSISVFEIIMSAYLIAIVIANCDVSKKHIHEVCSLIPKSRFQYKEILGQGSFGTVYRVIDKESETKTALAMKIMMYDPKKLGSLLKEIQMGLCFKDEPSLLGVNECFYKKGKKGKPEKVYLLTPKMQQGLDKVIYKNRLNRKADTNYQSWKVKAMIKMAQGLKKMHDQDMIHRDIKLENIMIGPENSKEEADARLVDFGLSTIARKGHVEGLAGTPYYMAPEISKREPYDQSVDIYALGITFYLFLRNEDVRLIYSQMSKKVSLIVFDYIQPYQGLLQAMVRSDASKRPNIDEVIEALEKIENKEESGFPDLKIVPYMNDVEKCMITNMVNQEMLQKNRNFIKYSAKTFSGENCSIVLQKGMKNGQFQKFMAFQNQNAMQQQNQYRQQQWTKNRGARRGGRNQKGRSRKWANYGKQANAFYVARILI